MAKRQWQRGKSRDNQNMGVRKHGSQQSRLDGNYFTNPRTGFDKEFYQSRERQGYMTFGKYKGKHISQIPTSYKNWLIENIDRTEHPGLIKALKNKSSHKVGGPV